MNPTDKQNFSIRPHTCCPSHDQNHPGPDDISRRKFIKVTGGSALSVVTLSGLSWSALAGSGTEEYTGIIRKTLVVKPILVYSTPEYQHQSSWRSWGGIQTENDVQEETSRIREELRKLQSKADFPVEFLLPARVRSAEDIDMIDDLKSADVFIVYAAGGWMDTGNILINWL